MTTYNYLENSNLQPHQELDFEGLVSLEESLESFSRSNWDQKIEVFFPDDRTDYVVVDQVKKRLIFFSHGISQNPRKFNILFQILNHWVIGSSKGGDSDVHTKIKNIQKAISLIFNGSQSDLFKLRSQLGKSDGRTPSLDWNLLHYPLEKAPLGLKGFLVEFEIPNQYADFSWWVAYGLVSKSVHRRTNKREILSVAQSFFEERGFETAEPIWARDYSRAEEHVVLYPGRAVFGDADFRAMVGINFGFDNGLSGYRVGLGLMMEDGQQAWLHPKYLFRHSVRVENNVPVESFGWIHHENHGAMEQKLDQFLSTAFNKMFDTYAEIIKMSKDEHFPNENISRKRLGATHYKEFEDHAEALQEHHTKFLDLYGFTNYAHYKTWLALSDDLQGLRSSRAKWVAEAVLVSAGLKPMKR
jgi:hypothetical protein